MAEPLGVAVLELRTDNSPLASGLARAEQQTRTAAQRMQSIAKGMATAGKQLSIGVTAPLVALAALSARAAADQAEAVAQLTQAVTNAGRQGEIAVANLEAHASQMQAVTRFGDDIQLQAMTTIEALSGVGEQQLKALSDAAMDMATVLDRDLKTVSEAIGKTVSGASDALGRFGVDIDSSITDPVRRAEAVVAALKRQFGGAAEAAAKVGMGPWIVFQNRLGEIGERFGNILLPRLTRFLDKLDGVLTWLENADPKFLEFITTLALLAAAIGPVLLVLSPLVKVGGLVVGAVIKIVAALGGAGAAGVAATAGLGSAGTAMAGVGTAGTTAGAVLTGVIVVAAAAAAIAFIALGVKAVQLGTDIKDSVEASGESIKTFVASATELFEQLGATMAAGGALSITTSVQSMATSVEAETGRAKTAIGTFVRESTGAFSRLLPDVRGFVEGMGDAVGNFVDTKLTQAKETLGRWVDRVGGLFQQLYDRVVGHSIVPDMVNAVLTEYEGMRDGTERIMGKIRDSAVTDWQTIASTAISQAGQMVSQLEALFGAYFDWKSAQELSGAQNALDLINWRLSNEEMSAEEEAKLQYEKLKLEHDVAEKSAKIQLAQAKAQKALALIQIAINTASAIVLAYAQLGPIAGTVAAVIIGVLGAAQAAIVAATPIPTSFVPPMPVPPGISVGGLTETPAPGGEAGGSGGGSMGAAASYQQARPINITVDIHGNTIAGDGSFRDLAFAIRAELETIDELGL